MMNDKFEFDFARACSEQNLVQNEEQSEYFNKDVVIGCAEMS